LRLKRYILAGLSGVLMVLGFPGINLSYLAWVALVPLLVSVYDANWKQSLKLGLVAGIIYFGGTMNWLMALHPFSTLFWVMLGFAALILYLSSYVFIFTVSVNFVTRCWILDARYRRPASSSGCLAYSFLVAVVWTGLEILRGRLATGLPWAGLGHTQWDNLPLIQISSFTGMYGVTFLIAMINGTIANFLIDIRRWRSSLKSAVVPFALLIASLVYGWLALSGSPQGEKVKIELVPGNIRQMEKLRSWGRAEWIFDRYACITELAAAEKPDIIVWPETSVPQYTFLSGTAPSELRYLVQRWNAYFLIGTPHTERHPERKTYNAAFLLSPAGEEIDRYYKIHLVPVSEYFPMKRYLPDSWQKLVTGVSDWDMGSRYTVFSAPPAKFGVVICFESVFPELFRKFVSKGVNLMGIITNDAWFRGTYAPEQHYSMAPFRAVENRVAVFRCANYGISCIIDPWGRTSRKVEAELLFSIKLGKHDPRSDLDGRAVPEILKQAFADHGYLLSQNATVRAAKAGTSWLITDNGKGYSIWKERDKKLDVYEEKYLVGEVFLRQGGTFYTRHGDYLPWACLTIATFLVFQTWWYRRRSQFLLH
jgi:apolipoprotein N-acyltransferase